MNIKRTIESGKAPFRFFEVELTVPYSRLDQSLEFLDLDGKIIEGELNVKDAFTSFF